MTKVISPVGLFSIYWLLIFSIYIIGGVYTSIYTVLTILLYILSFLAGCFIYSEVIKIHSSKKVDKVKNVNLTVFAIILLYFLIVSAIIGVWGYISSVSESDLFATYILGNAEELRRLLATGNASPSVLSWTLNKASYFIPAVLLIMGAYLASNFTIRRKVCFFIFLTTSYLYPLLLMQRDLILFYTVVAFFPIIYNKINFSTKFAVKLSIYILLFALVLIYLPIVLRNEEGGTNLFEKLHGYLIGSFFGLDAFLYGYNGHVLLLEDQKNYITSAGFSFYDMEMGRNTFKELYLPISKIFNWEPVSLHGEYIFEPVMTNIYTVIRPIYQDFGFMGLIFISLILGILSSFSYCKLKSTGDLFWALVYSSVVYAIIRQFGGFVFSFLYLIFGLIIIKLIMGKNIT